MSEKMTKRAVHKTAMIRQTNEEQIVEAHKIVGQRFHACFGLSKGGHDPWHITLGRKINSICKSNFNISRASVRRGKFVERLLFWCKNVILLVVPIVSGSLLLISTTENLDMNDAHIYTIFWNESIKIKRKDPCDR